MKGLPSKRFDQVTARQVRRFIVAGCCATGADALVYFLLVSMVGRDMGHDGPKFASFVTGTLVAYVVNKFWTFGSRQRSFVEMGSFFALYTAALGVNVGMNHLVLMLFEGATIPAFVVATGCSTVLNFLGQKFWVFRGKSQ
ncbi:MAG: GtrA family protein [Deltaproteobacteria bacterium]|nr:GtrA family protein [Deltaproteobacteria bacterium]